MGPPTTEPIGLQLSRTAKLVSRAFDDALGDADGSLPMWLILLSLKSQQHGAQWKLAQAVGIEGPTLTHHLNRMENAGLVTRRRDPENRRVHLVEVTEAGEAAFHRLLATVRAFDRRLRAGFTAEELAALGGMLERLQANVGTPMGEGVTA
jgi:MarR family transcriptional regulator, transcriptional regulator for hemolysin